MTDALNLRVLVLVRHFLPGTKHGGPVRSISNLADQLGKKIKFDIVTLDRDATDDEPYKGITRNAWNKVGNARVWYVGPGESVATLASRLVQAGDYSVVYLNSFFDLQFSISPILRLTKSRGQTPGIVVAARGEFSPGALRLKTLKKHTFLIIARLISAYKHVVWQATSLSELEHITHAIGVKATNDGPGIALAENLPATPNNQSGEEIDSRDHDLLSVCFLSRISRKKNLGYALELLSNLTEPVSFQVFGNAEDKQYLAECMSIAKSLPDNISVQFSGHIEHHAVPEMLSRKDLFLFPTLGENFGHVIFEALSAGVPVMTSDQTPWSDLEDAGAGWTFDLERPELFVEKLREIAGWTHEQHARAKEAAVTLAYRTATADGPRDRNMSMFERAARLARTENTFSSENA